MKVVITGSSGFIGRSLKAELNKRDITVVGLCRNPKETTDILFDLNNPTSQIPSVDVLIHTAYTTQAKDLKQAYKANVTGSIALFDYCHAKNIRIIFLSSGSYHFHYF